MIPTSYLFKDIYIDHWGDPANPHAVDVPEPGKTPRGGWFAALTDRLGHWLGRRRRTDAWSFVIPAEKDADCGLIPCR